MRMKTIKNTKTWRRVGATALSLSLAWGMGLVHTLPYAGAASSSTTCGKGDHGLSSELKKGNGVEEQNLQFTDIDFLNPNTGRAAGQGFLIGTSNAGCTWQSIYTGQWQFKQLNFPNNVTGYALAGTKDSSATYLIRTDDGGSNWKRLDTPGVPTFKQIDFSDKNTGYGYTYNGAYRTADGGVTWTKVSTPANTRAVTFTTDKLGYAVVVVPGVGYKLEKTTDGGKTWTTALRVKSDTWNGGDLYASGSQVWAVLYGDAGMSQQSYSLYASGDQGKQWRQVFAQSTAGAGPAPGANMEGKGTGPANPGGHPGNMALIGNQTAYLSAGSPAADKIGIGRSFDAGSTWKNIDLKASGASSRISFPAAKTGWLVVTSGNTPAVYETTDGGITWLSKISFHSDQD
ncbi:WD40/YVTN/BNR-like repeat-containing protein [Paenibacillus amylolyticus]|uniref:WD40/YVTN/BNR-like repeat-containing protein n=1 Tax=Paenibacillus amylolyticus TaxID=1451 RepID=UPI003EC06F7A